MNALTEFLAMGGYGRWVWSAWGLTLLVFAILEWQTRTAHAAALVRARRASGVGEGA